MRIYETRLTGGITRTKEFERKKLAAFAVNVGTKCGHGCHYCSSGALLRMHRSFADVSESPFDGGYAIVDPDTPERLARDAKRIRNRGMVQLCTTVDAWSPEAQQHDLDRRCLEAILAEPGWTVRILTKNAAVAKDFDLVHKHKDRVLVSMSITATADNADVISVVEPHASPIAERMAVMQQAHDLGLRTYAMYCPLMARISNLPPQIDELVRFAQQHDAEEIFVEPVNPRGPGLRLTQEVLVAAGYGAEAKAVEAIRTRKVWSLYVRKLVANVQRSMRLYSHIERLRFLLYPGGLAASDTEQIRHDDAGVVWLGKD